MMNVTTSSQPAALDERRAECCHLARTDLVEPHLAEHLSQVTLAA